MTKVSFVILHYGDVRVTKTCIESILGLKAEADINILIVDNDSHKGDAERREQANQYTGDNVEVLYMEENAGFSKANNSGYEYVRRNYNPDYIVVANNDIEFIQLDFIERIEDSYQKHEFDILSPDVVSREDGHHQSPIDTKARTIQEVDYTIRMNTICLKLFPIAYPLLKRRFSEGGKVISSVQNVESDIVPCGACIILSDRFVKQEEKVFTPETQFYYEEYLLHNRCKKQGYGILYDPSLQVLHGDGVATKKKTGTSKDKLKFMMKNTLESAKVYKKELLKSRIE